MHVLPALHLFLFLLQLIRPNSADELDSELPGHMKPLGSHMDPLPLRRINYLPSPREFRKKYVSPKHPLIMEGALNNASVWRNWQDDDYLREHFGNENVEVEQAKKENRSNPVTTMSFKDFLDRYKEEDIYMVQDLPTPMYQEWELPRPLLCGGFMDNLNMAVVWFSSGGTNSVLHSDSSENLHCLVSGMKKLVLIDPRYSKIIGPEHEQKGFYDINVEKVDMTIYPELSRVPWYLAELKEGDCLYIPFMWIHNVRSFGRNMGVNVWWKQFEFNDSDCPPDREEPEFLPLGQVELVPEISVMDLFQQVAQPDNSVMAADILRPIEQITTWVDLASIMKLLDILQPGCNGILTDYTQIPKQRLMEGDNFFLNLLEGLQVPDELDDDKKFKEEWKELLRETEEFGEEEEELMDQMTNGKEEIAHNEL